MTNSHFDSPLKVANDAVDGPPRRSTRKRNAVESYARFPSKSTNDSINPDLPNKRLKKENKSASTNTTSKVKHGAAMAIPKQLRKSSKKSNGAHNKQIKQHTPIKLVPGKKRAQPGEEKRLKTFRKKMPLSYESTMFRATTQRMFVIDRTRHVNEDCPHSTPDCPMETVVLAGTTGNIYTVNITHVPSCNCPNFIKGNKQCKHILYVLVKVLKAPGNLMYQAAFLTSELRKIFNKAGPLPSSSVSEEDKDGKRKPVEGDCPICCEELSTDAGTIVWCKAACGNNLHKSCFDRWAAAKGVDRVTCPYCRTAWESSVDGKVLKDVKESGVVGRDGYINVASQLGLSGARDYSTYHSYWVRHQR